jgi:hypothetical protein
VRIMVEITSQSNDNNPKTEALKSFGRHWFCVASMPDNSIYMADSNDISSFSEIINKSVLAWIDYRSDDFINDVHLGTQLGFNDQMITNLITNWRTSYEDYKTEIGIKIPSIQINLNGNLDVQLIRSPKNGTKIRRFFRNAKIIEKGEIAS